MASQKLSFRQKLHFNFVEAALSGSLKILYNPLLFSKPRFATLPRYQN
ncbi:hypothetical protein EIKCOROL_01203 [Eikenella corrodens ATCC 23834]|uniref:Uncharacterized protein n=1 Tax=Eikenella corrodens ATCC 23834 TaxID=546274 RepID=C0DV14_EIKCO|nr:hypothetical protein EIKCOROL_01203 [Eikenella corrodens ATCC 23834]